MQKMIIANRLADGAVAFLAPNHEWTASVEEGAVITTELEAEQSLAVAKRHEEDCLIVDPVLIDVTVTDGRPRPTAIREAIRAFGPTIRTDLAPPEQAEAAVAWR
ncbi:MAG: DUF2849 domain-containing protein [Gammaproteobacteria bacterium]|nr:DUF2849 domain-containing protein [Gammaproteobacteria bacterium]